MKPTTIKAIAGLSAVVLVSTAYFIFGCGNGSFIALLGAILVLAGKEAGEIAWIRNGGGG